MISSNNNLVVCFFFNEVGLENIDNLRNFYVLRSLINLEKVKYLLNTKKYKIYNFLSIPMEDFIESVFENLLFVYFNNNFYFLDFFNIYSSIKHKNINNVLNVMKIFKKNINLYFLKIIFYLKKKKCLF